MPTFRTRPWRRSSSCASTRRTWRMRRTTRVSGASTRPTRRCSRGCSARAVGGPSSRRWDSKNGRRAARRAARRSSRASGPMRGCSGWRLACSSARVTSGQQRPHVRLVRPPRRCRRGRWGWERRRRQRLRRRHPLRPWWASASGSYRPRAGWRRGRAQPTCSLCLCWAKVHHRGVHVL